MIESLLTVTTAASARDLTTIQACQLELGASVDPAWLALAIPAASQEIETHCRRIFAQDVLSETFRQVGASDACAHARLILARRPVVSIASVVADDVTLDSDEYEIDAQAGLLYRLDSSDRRAIWSEEKIVVAYTAGYVCPGSETRPTLPADLQAAAIELVKQRWFARHRDPLLKGEAVPGAGDAQYWVGGELGGLPAPIAARLVNHVQSQIGG